MPPGSGHTKLPPLVFPSVHLFKNSLFLFEFKGQMSESIVQAKTQPWDSEAES